MFGHVNISCHAIDCDFFLCKRSGMLRASKWVLFYYRPSSSKCSLMDRNNIQSCVCKIAGAANFLCSFKCSSLLRPVCHNRLVGIDLVFYESNPPSTIPYHAFMQWHCRFAFIYLLIPLYLTRQGSTLPLVSCRDC